MCIAAAQRAAEARLTALRTRKRVANRAEDLRLVAKDARSRAREVTEAVKSRAEDVRQQAGAVRERVNRELEKRAKDAEKMTSKSKSAHSGIDSPPKPPSSSTSEKELR